MVRIPYEENTRIFLLHKSIEYIRTNNQMIRNFKMLFYINFSCEFVLFMTYGEKNKEKIELDGFSHFDFQIRKKRYFLFLF